MDKRTNVKSILVVAILYLSTSLYSLLMLLPGHDINTENRALSKKPKFAISTIKTFPQQFETYFNDHIPFKSVITKYNNLVKFNVLHSPSNTYVVRGKNEFLFYNDDLNIKDFQGKNYFTDNEMAYIATYFNQVNSFLSARGIKFYVLINPNKATAYYDQMPDNISRNEGKNRTERLIDFINQNTELKVVYPKEDILALKKDFQLYYKNDTHWNNLGGFVGVQALLRKMDRDVTNIEDMKYTVDIMHKGSDERLVTLDLSNMLSLNGTVSEEYYNIINYKTDVNVQKDAFNEFGYTATSNILGDKLMIYRDSFATSMEPFLNKNFKNVFYFWTAEMNQQQIETYKPDIVVFECVERHLDGILNAHFK